MTLTLVVPAATRNKPAPAAGVGNHRQEPAQRLWGSSHKPHDAARPSRTPLLQRTCACGGSAGPFGECAGCQEDAQHSLQAKLSVSAPGDRDEQEADRIADQVVGSAEPTAIHDVPLRMQREGSFDAGIGAAPSIVEQAVAASGEALDGTTRSYFEARFGRDFGAVRVHTGATAAQAAGAVRAHAFTVGADVVFAPGQFAPGSRDGRRLLAHELTHVVQQGAASPDTRPTQRRAVQRYSWEENCNADTRSAIMGAYKLATWGTKRAQLMLQAGSPSGVLKTWFDFLFGDKADTDTA
ncbi:MAG TPA: DUF4157 domain-containing protein, partial [Pseudolabrys sp.]|nr:DUF4157 domain-containing protein [Pseudolabrys sp.]